MVANAEVLNEHLRCGCTAKVNNPILLRLLPMLLAGKTAFDSDRVCGECRARGLLEQIQAAAALAGLPRMKHSVEDIASGAAYDREANRLESKKLLERLYKEHPPITDEDILAFSRNEGHFSEALRPGQWSHPWNYSLMVQLRLKGKQ